MNKILLIICLFVIVIPVYAGDLYETDEYLSAINVDNPYNDNSPPVMDSGLGTSSNGGNSPDPLPKEPVPDSPDTSPDNSGDNRFDFSGKNFNQFLNFGSNSWATGTKNQNATKTNDYLTQAILTNNGTVYRSRGKRYEKTKETFYGIENLQMVSIIPYRVRKIRDEQVAYQKIQRTVKTPFERCYTATFISDDYLGDGFASFVFEMNFSTVTMLSLSV
jgi:hypothetical protein